MYATLKLDQRPRPPNIKRYMGRGRKCKRRGDVGGAGGEGLGALALGWWGRSRLHINAEILSPSINNQWFSDGRADGAGISNFLKWYFKSFELTFRISWTEISNPLNWKLESQTIRTEISNLLNWNLKPFELTFQILWTDIWNLLNWISEPVWNLERTLTLTMFGDPRIVFVSLSARIQS